MDDDGADDSDSEFEGPQDDLAPLVWNGPPPRDTGSKLSMRYPRKSQLFAMMRENGWSSMKGQWVEKHRRNGANPETLNMYFDETDACKLRNNIVEDIQELNGDESLFKGEIADALRHSKFVVCRGPKASAAELRNKHAWSTAEGDPAKIGLVVYPVISRKKCHLLMIILKGNPKPKTQKQIAKQRQLARDVRLAFPPELQDVIYVSFTKTGYQSAESFKYAARALFVALSKEESLENGWMDIATTQMSDIPALRLKRMYKFDGSSTHSLNDHRFLLEIFQQFDSMAVSS